MLKHWEIKNICTFTKNVPVCATLKCKSLHVGVIYDFTHFLGLLLKSMAEILAMSHLESLYIKSLLLLLKQETCGKVLVAAISTRCKIFHLQHLQELGTDVC